MYRRVFVIGFSNKYSKTGRAYTIVSFTCDWPDNEAHAVGKMVGTLIIWGDNDYSNLIGKDAEASFDPRRKNRDFALSIREI